MKYWYLLLLIALVPLSVFGQQTIFRQPEPVIPVLPETGGFFDPTRPGNGIMLEVAPDGFVFGAFFYYTPQGVTKWATLAGPCVPVSEAERMATGVVCRVTQAAMNDALGGQCWGCPHTNPTNPPSTEMRDVEAVFFSPNRGELRASGTVLPLSRLSEIYPGQSIQENLVGTWTRVHYRMARDCPSCSSYIIAQDIGTVVVRPKIPKVNFWDVENPNGFPRSLTMAGFPFPSSLPVQYEVLCQDDAGAIIGCIGIFAAEGNVSVNQVLYQEPGSGMIRIVELCISPSRPNCVKFEGQPSAVVQFNAVLSRTDLFVSPQRAVLRRTTALNNSLVIQSEEVWTKVDDTQKVPISVSFPF